MSNLTPLPTPLDDLEPRLVWQAFDALCQVPRPSRWLDPVTTHVDAWAAEHGFAIRRDDYGNRVIRVPARSGREATPCVVLQAHLDLVAEQRPDGNHDFTRDPIRLVRRQDDDGDWIVAADGTTLGADNGIGVAMAMAAAIDPALDRGPLELLFTLDEEIGLRGARALDPSLVAGRLMINLDSEVDGALFIGCAGAAGVEATRVVRRTPLPADRRLFRISVDGLLGGHSGLEIDRHRGHAISLLAQILVAALDATASSGRDELLIAAIDGGDKGNAIPRSAEAIVWLRPEHVDRVRRIVGRHRATFTERYRRSDPDVVVTLEPIDASEPVPAPFEASSGRQLLRLFDALPVGVRAMSPDVPGLVQTSANLARVRTVAEAEASRVEWLVSLRSSSNPELDALGQSIASLCALAEARVQRLPGYPGWSPDLDSPLLARAAAVHERLFGEAPSIESVHAGLECGVLNEILGGLDVISFGPEIRGAHSPDERVSVASTAKSYRWLAALLNDLAAEKW
ncbi:MAG: beta-Ala-His dipeptidase [Acidobacteriota bacterium]